MAGLSVVIPAWNDQARLSSTLSRYLPYLEGREGPFEVIVVVDGQDDDTAGVANSYSHRNVRVLAFSHKLGKGGAVLAGLREAQYEYIGYLDADGPVPPESLHQMIDVLKECDGVIASRWVYGSKVDVPQDWERIVLGRAWNLMVRMVLFLPHRDTQCGAKFFKRAVVTPLLKTIAVTNWAFDVDLLFHLKKAGYEVREAPITWSEGGGSKLRVEGAVPRMFVSLIGIRVMNLPFSKRVPQAWVDWFQRRWGEP